MPSNGVVSSGGRVRERQKILQEGLFERQRIFAADLQVEGVELVARRKLHGGEDRLVPPRRAKRLLNEPHEAFRRRPDVELADQRQLGLGAAEDRRRKAEPDIDRVREHRLAGAGRGHENVDHQRPHRAAGRIVGPDRPVRQAKQHRSPLPGRDGVRPRQERQRLADRRQRRIAGRGKREPRHGAHHAVERIPGDPGRLAIAPALDPLRERGRAPAQFPDLADRRPGREGRAQLDRDVVVLLTHLTQ